MPDHVNDGRPTGTCTVRYLERDGTGRWDTFVAAAPAATFFHRAAWRDVIEQGLGHRSHYLYAERDGVIVGVLPLAEIRSWLFGHALISTPFCVYGGVVAADAESDACLTQAAVALAAKLKVDYLELRNREPRNTDWPVKDLYVHFQKPIHPDHDINFKGIGSKRRNMVRKGAAAGLEARHDGNVADFYRVYSESVRNLGTPVLPRSYYVRLKQAFDEAFEITVVTHQKQPVAASMSFYFRDEVHPYYAGGVWRARRIGANDFLYWALMQRAVERGARVFDFGRSKRGTGSYDFKKYWGFEPKPLPYAYRLVRARQLPDISPANKKYAVFIKGWQRLPLPVSCALGPWLARNLG